MKATEKNRLLNKPRIDLVKMIDELQLTVRGMLAQQRQDLAEDHDDPPFYWAIGYIGWGSWDSDVDFIDGGDAAPTAQMAVDAWEELRQQGTTQAYDQDNLGQADRTLLVYRIDEIGRATTDRRWVFKPKS